MIFRFFKISKPRQFYVKPRYFDPVKEEREERERRIKAEMGIIDENDPSASYRALIKGQFRRHMSIADHKSADVQRRKSNNRLIILILILAFLVYFMFYR